MDVDQPEASTSMSTTPPQHYASFIFDSTISRERYIKLVEADGVIHKLVQRLMEKSGAGDNLNLSLVITATGSLNSGSVTSSCSLPFRQISSTTSGFLTSLPSLASRFFPGGAGSIRKPKWPSFASNQNDDSEALLRTAKKRIQDRDSSLLSGVVHGIELQSQGSTGLHGSHLSSILASMSPPNAAKILTPLYTPPLTPPYSASPVHRYVIIISDSETANFGTEGTDTRFISARDNWDPTWDGLGWDEIAKVCREREIRCSSVIVRTLGHGMGESSNRMKAFVREAASVQLDESWFEIPADIEVTLTGLAMDDGSLPESPSAVTTMATEILQTPVSNPPSIPSGQNPDSKAFQNQAMAIRLAQVTRAAIASGNSDPQLLQSLMAVSRDGGNQAALQQMRHLMALQNQQRQASKAANAGTMMNAEGLLDPSQMASTVSSGDLQRQQLLLAAMQAQRQQQAMNQMNGNNATVPPPQQSMPTPAKLWTGSIIWTVKDTQNNHSPISVPVDASLYSNHNLEELQLNLWPSKLLMQGVSRLDIQGLQAYSSQNSAPFIMFSPIRTGSAIDSAGQNRADLLAKNLNSRGTMALVKFGPPGCGIAIFGALGSGPNGEQPRLMGIVCMKAPIPSFGAQPIPAPQVLQNPRPPPMAVQNTPVQQMQQPIPSQLQQRPSFNNVAQPQPVSINGLNMPAFPGQTHLQNQTYQTQPQSQLQLPQNTNSNQLLNDYHQALMLPQQPNRGQQLPQQQHQQAVAGTFIPSTFPAQPGNPNRSIITPDQIRTIKQMAVHAGINLPPNFDLSNLPPGGLQDLVDKLRVRGQQHQQQQHQQQTLQMQQQNMHLQQQQMMLQQQQQQGMGMGQAQFQQ